VKVQNRRPAEDPQAGGWFPEPVWTYFERASVRFSMVSMEFFIYIILPAALWPWGWLNLEQKWVPGIFPRG